MQTFTHQTAKDLMAATLVVIVMLVGSGKAQSSDDPKAMLAKGDYRKAESLYRKALAKNPTSPELLTDLGVSLQMQGRSAEAMAALRHALRLKYLPMTYALLAEERCKSRDIEGAKTMLDRILSENSAETRILAIVAPCYLDADEPIASVQVYQALSRDADFPGDLACVKLTESYVAAAKMFGAMLRSAPNGSEYLEALVAAKEGGSPDARSAYPLAEKRSRFFHPEADSAQALADWRQHPNDTALIYQLSVLTGEAVLHTFQLCSEQFPDSLYVEQFRAGVLADQGEEDEAVAILERIIQNHPEISEMRYNLGMLYRKQGDWEKAAEAFQKQVQADPQDERVAARFSEAMLNLARYPELQTFLMPRVHSGHPPLWALIDLGNVDQKLGDSSSAIHWLTEAEKRDPTNKTIHYHLMRLYTQTGNSAAATRESASFQKAKD